MPFTNIELIRDTTQYTLPRRQSNPQSNAHSSMTNNVHGHFFPSVLTQPSITQPTTPHDTRDLSFQHPSYPLLRHQQAHNDMVDSSSVHPHSFPPGIEPLHTERPPPPPPPPQQQQQKSRRVSLTSPTGLKRASVTNSTGKSVGTIGLSAQTSNPRFKATNTNTPHHTRRFTRLISDDEPDTTYLWGYLLFFCTMIGFVVSMYALVVSTYMPETKNPILDWIKHDSHYCMLVPVTLPVTILAVLFNWLGMKLFRHN